MRRTSVFLRGVFVLVMAAGSGWLPCPAEETGESVHIVTYYPSPYGSYQELTSEVIIFKTADGPPGRVLGREAEGMVYYDSEDKALKFYDGDEWRPVGGAASELTPLVGRMHTEKDCSDSGGEPVDSGSGLKQCRFAQSSCPFGWTQYQRWSTTAQSQKEVYNHSGNIGNCIVVRYNFRPSGTCYAVITPGPGHSWANKSPESCSGYYIGTYTNPTTQIGCY